jgi:hypothetical protein
MDGCHNDGAGRHHRRQRCDNPQRWYDETQDVRPPADRRTLMSLASCSPPAAVMFKGGP